MTNCFFCKKGTLEETVTTYMVDLKDCIIIVRNVPCEECSQCGEKFFSDSVMQRLDDIVQKARSLASEVFVTDYSKKVA
ncbi:MAG: type II toxin-antitoxin system MqsA family antitoxin [Treponema sp.]|nr:type II toxin-antitoxin system MqsA family antitoxin [Treponema sp.]